MKRPVFITQVGAISHKPLTANIACSHIFLAWINLLQKELYSTITLDTLNTAFTLVNVNRSLLDNSINQSFNAGIKSLRATLPAEIFYWEL
jgi:hypothetical protein